MNNLPLEKGVKTLSILSIVQVNKTLNNPGNRCRERSYPVVQTPIVHL